jgi:hypothetical protein
MIVPALGFPHHSLQAMKIAAFEPGASTRTGVSPETSISPFSRAGRTRPCHRIRTRGLPLGNEHALPLVLIKIAGPIIVEPVATAVE